MPQPRARPRPNVTTISFVVAGRPGAYHQFTPDLAEDSFQAVFFRDHEPKIAFGDEYWWQTIAVDNHTGTLDFLHDGREARKSFGQGFVDAVQAARSPRFERGSGGVRPSPLENHEA